MNGSRRQFLLALLLEVLGAAGALLITTRTWQTVLAPRPRPLADDTLHLSGRTIDSSPTALALVALAGVVAVLATHGLARRLVGVVVLASGALLVWRSLDGLRAVTSTRALELLTDKHSGVGLDSQPQVTVHTGWAWLSAACGLLTIAAGTLIALRGHRWSGMSARYESPTGRRAPDAEQQRHRANASMWQALDRGDDPTTRPEQGPGH